jgi:transposase
VTNSNSHESKQIHRLLPDDQPIEAVYADKAYDQVETFDAIVAKGAKAVIPPRSGAAMSIKLPTSWGAVERNRNVRETWLLGKDEWKAARRYHRRSAAEYGFHRYKKIFGDRMQSIEHSRQVTETRVKVRALNKMTRLGMPKTILKASPSPTTDSS